MKYYYGTEEDEILTHTNIHDFIDDYIGYDEPLPIIIGEVKVNRNEHRFCKFENVFTEDCGKTWCNDYQPRNGKNGICKHLTWGLSETGRKWKLTENGLEKISKRREKK